MLGDYLYALQPQEARSAPVLQTFFDLRFGGAGLNSLAFIWRVPNEKICLLTHLFIFAAAGGVTTVTRVTANLLDEADNIITTLAQARALGAFSDDDAIGPRVNMLTQPITLYANVRVAGSAIWSAADAGNFLEVSVGGFLMPRGTVQLGALERQ